MDSKEFRQRDRGHRVRDPSSPPCLVAVRRPLRLQGEDASSALSGRRHAGWAHDHHRIPELDLDFRRGDEFVSVHVAGVDEPTDGPTPFLNFTAAGVAAVGSPLMIERSDPQKGFADGRPDRTAASAAEEASGGDVYSGGEPRAPSMPQRGYVGHERIVRHGTGLACLDPGNGGPGDPTATRPASGDVDGSSHEDLFVPDAIWSRTTW